MHFYLAANPFFESFFQSDWMGKLIYISLFALSVISWALLIQKFLLTKQASKQSESFLKQYKPHRLNPLALEVGSAGLIDPLHSIYLSIKKQTVEILNKNRKFGGKNTHLSQADIDFVETHTYNSIAKQTQVLEKNLYVLGIIYTLAPFLGLLGTVWGILITLPELQGSHHNAVLSGLSLALATTVVGLVIAIPALIGYHYFKSEVKNLHNQMEDFSNEVLASIEMQYRQVDIRS